MSDLVAAYLFFAGAGSGTAFVAVLCQTVVAHRGCSLIPRTSRSYLFTRRIYALALFASLLLVALGVLCLLFDLGRPELAFKLFTRPHATFMTFGAWSLALLMASLVALEALLLLPSGGEARLDSHRRGGMRAANTAASVVALLSAACVMVYAGLLLCDVGTVPLWNTELLPALFAASALASGTAVVVLCAAASAGDESAMTSFFRRAAYADGVMVLAEAVVTAAYLVAVFEGEGGFAALEPLLTGDQSVLFVGGFLALGLAGAGVLDIAQVRVSAFWRASSLSAAFSLAGAFCLRLALIQAGALPPETFVL